MGMEAEKPKAEHQWLQKLVGEWTYEMEAYMGPDQPKQNFPGVQTFRSLGGLWVIGEFEGEGHEGGISRSVITLGFDPAKGSFVGSFVSGMMSKLWLYDGKLDATGKRLVLDSEGPAFSGEGLAKYQDTVEVVSDDHWRFRSQIFTDGKWNEFMVQDCKRAGKTPQAKSRIA